MRGIILCLFLAFLQGKGVSQNSKDNRYITTAVPMLKISPDARASGIGEQGVASQADVFSQHWNPSKYNFAFDDYGVGVSYVPYGTITDIFFLNASGYFKHNERSAWSGGISYFSYGEIDFTTNEGLEQGVQKVYEAAFEGTYSLLLSDRISTAITARFINSSLKTLINTSGNSSLFYALDLSMYYQSLRFRYGIVISNIGPKVSYQDQATEMFLPTTLRAGIGYDILNRGDNRIYTALQFSKLLVPTPPIRKLEDTDGNGRIDENDRYIITGGRDNNINFLPGMIQSFADAPGGFREEIAEIAATLGLEYKYKKTFAARMGYSTRDISKGDSFISMGLGVEISSVTLDLAYLYSLVIPVSPMYNKVRLSLSFLSGKNRVVKNKITGITSISGIAQNLKNYD